jgi:hypothetical protein
MSKIEVDAITQQSGTTLTVGGGACKTAVVDATTVTLGRSGGTVQLASGASQTGFGRTGTVDWQTTPKTATFTAVSGEGYFCNTTSGSFTCNLPAGSAGAIVSLADYAGTWQTNSLIVSPNGTEKIGGISSNVSLITEGQSVTFVYVDETQGWVNTQDSTSNVRGNPNLVATGGSITTSGDCKIHTFTGPGTFTVSNASSTAANNVVSYLVVAGGGGSGSSCAGGGGGAGGYREVKSPLTPYTASPLDGYPSAPNRVTVTAQAYPITVGSGGAGGPPGVNGSQGNDSVFATITSAGGGFGGGPSSGANGGSGGGGGGNDARLGGTGNTPPVSPAQGKNGGNGATGSGGYQEAAGGGGGATGAGSSGGSGNGPGGPGGAGATTSINNTPTARAGGGGGGTGGNDGPATSSGGSGGGGSGGNCQAGTAATAGTANTGGGGGGSGGSGSGKSKNGGSGIVIIRYKFQ